MCVCRFFKQVVLIAILMVASRMVYAQDTARLMIIRKMPLVEGVINGKRAYFIIDTGATVTLLNETQARYYGFNVYDNNYLKNTRMMGVGGASAIKGARRARVTLGKHEINFISKTANLDEIAKHFNTHNIRLAGIIGTDLLTFLGCIIDYKTNALIFKRKD